MNDSLSRLAPWLLSPLAILGIGLLLAQLIGLLLAARGLPKLYGAVVAGLLLGVSGLGLVDSALLAQFQELVNAATALVLFEVGRKMDVQWLWRSGSEGAALTLACALRGLAAFACLAAFGMPLPDAAFIAVILMAASPIIYGSMVADANASGIATFLKRQHGRAGLRAGAAGHGALAGLAQSGSKHGPTWSTNWATSWGAWRWGPSWPCCATPCTRSPPA
ncbi:cation:proton antiporter [Massilia sp. H-1]|nr:cation:proton antiporter [Massilia sp. H-1]